MLRAARNPGSLTFRECTGLAEAFGFECARQRGSHHVYKHSAVPELVNLQEVKGMAKAYQVRQLLKVIERYGLRMRGGE
ncbi:MAG: type II toxin-antitoxin system HicA family toxin [Acidobacteria bacterium]|nr:type II toxin-antitoxin system HicA family toxin [Acidobacteriota bacterium]